MARRRSNRYQSMEDLAVDLRRLGLDLETGSAPSYEAVATRARPGRGPWLAVAGSLLALVTVGVVWTSRPSRSPPVDNRRVLVLPIEIQGKHASRGYVGRALAEALAINLALAENLIILPVPDAAAPGGENSSSRLRRALDRGAGRLLSGSWIHEDEGSYLTLSLVDAKDNRILWGTREDVSGGDLNRLVADASSEILAILGGQRAKMYDYPLYLKGGEAMAASRELLAVRTLFETDAPARELVDACDDLVTRFPDEPDAHALRLMMLADRGIVSRLDRACKALDRLDPKNPYTLMLRSNELLLHKEDPQAAMRGFDSLLDRSDLTPSARAWILRTRSRAQRLSGDLRGALDGLEEASRLEPANPWTLYHLAVTRYDTNDLEASATAASNVLALQPDFVSSHFLNGAVAAGRKDWAAAVSFFAEACERGGAPRDCAVHLLALTRGGAAGGNAEESTRAARAVDDPRVAYYLSWRAILERNRDEALRWLDRAARFGLRELPVTGSPDCSTQRSYCIYGFTEATTLTNPDLGTLFGDPEFGRIAARIREQKPE